MPRSKGNWDAYLSRREKKKTYRKGTKKGKKPADEISVFRSVVIGEKNYSNYEFQRSHIEKYADYRRKNPTPSEAKLRTILNDLNEGALRGKFVREYIISGKWIVDFYFPDIRLAIEVDGSVHLTGIQKKKDTMKDADASRFDITVLRVTNSEVSGNREYLICKLREGWRKAMDRKNTIIGKSYQ